MSHELRTPLNSLLILSSKLSRNPEGNLTAKQTEFAKTIHSSGNDLLMLINDILDLSKIESGTVVLDMGELRFSDMHSYVERTFRHVAESKGLDFAIELDPHLPRSIYSDSKRLQQVIKNLLSNAFKFTHHGKVSLAVAPAAAGWNPENDNLNHADEVIAFPLPTRASASPPTSSTSSSRRSSKRTAAPAASTAAPAWGWPSAANCRACWAAKFA